MRITEAALELAHACRYIACQVVAALRRITPSVRSSCGASRAVSRQLPGPCAQCGLSPAELFPIVSLVVAGRNQGRIPRPREYCCGIRACRAFGFVPDEAAVRGLTQDLCEADAQSGFHAVQCFPAGPVSVPVLRR